MHRFPILIAKDEKQLGHAFFGGLRVVDHGAPAFEADACGVPVTQPTGDVGKWDFQKRGIRLDLIGDKPEAVGGDFIAGAFAGCGRDAHRMESTKLQMRCQAGVSRFGDGLIHTEERARDVGEGGEFGGIVFRIGGFRAHGEKGFRGLGVGLEIGEGALVGAL